MLFQLCFLYLLIPMFSLHLVERLHIFINQLCIYKHDSLNAIYGSGILSQLLKCMQSQLSICDAALNELREYYSYSIFVNACVMSSVKSYCSSSVSRYDVLITIVPTIAYEPEYKIVSSNPLRYSTLFSASSNVP